MISLLTNLKKEMITLDRILIKDQNNPHISIESKEILAETRKHYKNTFKTRESNFNLLSENWKKEYQPSIGVKEEWFKELMEPVTEEKLNTTLKDLPNSKASGISNIKYEMPKKLRSEAKKVLR